jgi:uncharacterized protein YegL
LVIGTSVPSDLLANGTFEISALPLDGDGEAILSSGTSVTVTVQSPASIEARVEAQQAFAPSGNPLAVAVNIDASGSMATTDPTDARLAGAKALVETLLKAPTGFEAAIFRYPFAGALLQEFTDDPADLNAAIDQIGANGGTPTYTSLDIILDYMEDEKDASSYERAIVLLSDGQPGDANLKQSVCAKATSLQIPIYSIGLGPASDVVSNPNSFAVQEMRDIADCTSATYAGIAQDNIDVSAIRIFDSVAQATAKGNVEYQVQLRGSGFDTLRPGDLVTGLIRVSSGGGTASGEFSFRVP